jgi:hypothetical protein
MKIKIQLACCFRHPPRSVSSLCLVLDVFSRLLLNLTRPFSMHESQDGGHDCR